jgi:EpsI family protein
VKLGPRVFAVALLLALAAAYVHLNPPARLDLETGALSRFPLVLEGWRGRDRSFEEVVYEELSADDTLARRYANDEGDVVWFVIIFHQNARYGAHEPFICYTSHGWTIADRGVTRVSGPGPGLDAGWLVARSGGESRLALYWWYTAGDLATADREEFMARMARSGIVSNVTFGAFIRISTLIEEGDFDAAMARALSFAEAASEHVPELFDARPEQE